MNKRKLIISSVVFLSFIIFTFTFSSMKKTNNEVFAPKATASITPADTKIPEATIVAEELKRWPKPTSSPVMKSSGNSQAINLPVTTKPKRYLLVNPIQINEVKRTDYSDGIKIEYKYPQIDGLIDSSVQNRINKDIQGYADRLTANASLYKKDLLEVRLDYNVSANYNNILCITLYQSTKLTDDYYSMNEILLYELVNGNKLQLKDIFRKELSFPGVLNRAIDEYFLKHNLEEDALAAPFRGILENQSYVLNENSLFINYYMNEEIRPGLAVMFRQVNIDFKLSEFNNLIDIYDKYPDTGKEIYKNKFTKRKMLPNKLNYLNREANYIRDTYSGMVFQLEFKDMVNNNFQKKLNEICSYWDEADFKKLLPDNIEKKAELYKMPNFMISYGLTANYGDVVCVANNIHYSISETIRKDEIRHFAYNIITGNKLELKDIFKKDYDYKKAIFKFINDIAVKKNISISEEDVYSMLLKPDFWFDNDFVRVYLDIQGLSNEKYIPIPFEYFGEENFTIRE